MHYERQHLSVHLSHPGPIRTVHVWHIQIIALITPTLVEDLFELFLRIEIHAQIKIQSTRTWCWWCATRINKIKLRRWWCSTAATSRATAWSTSGCRPVNQLASIGTDFVRRDAVCESSGATITKPVA